VGQGGASQSSCPRALARAFYLTKKFFCAIFKICSGGRLHKSLPFLRRARVEGETVSTSNHTGAFSAPFF